jgi:oxygen-independent coproporphyrinogen-3 oxidase
MTADIPLGLYVHFPWCVSKCPYCDFNSHALRGALPHDTYLAALCADLEQQCIAQQAKLIGREVTSLFMGGGTPSLFPPAAIAQLLLTVRRNLVVAPDAEKIGRAHV